MWPIDGASKKTSWVPLWHDKLHRTSRYIKYLHSGIFWTLPNKSVNPNPYNRFASDFVLAVVTTTKTGCVNPPILIRDTSRMVFFLFCHVKQSANGYCTCGLDFWHPLIKRIGILRGTTIRISKYLWIHMVASVWIIAEETEYDLITRICAAIVGVPIVLVSLVAEDGVEYFWGEPLVRKVAMLPVCNSSLPSRP